MVGIIPCVSSITASNENSVSILPSRMSAPLWNLDIWDLAFELLHCRRNKHSIGLCEYDYHMRDDNSDLVNSVVDIASIFTGISIP